MSKSKKTSLIIIAAVVVLLVIVYLVAYKGTLFGLKKELQFSPEKYTQDPTEITGIDVAELDRDVKVVASQDGDIHIDYYTSDKIVYTMEVNEDGVLEVTYTDNMRWYDNFKYIVADKGGEIVVSLPADFDGGVTLSAYEADLSVENADITGDLSVTANVGDISVSNVTTGGAVTLETTTGDVITDNITLDGDFSNKQVTGSYNGNNIACGGAYKLDLTKGDIAVSKLESPDIYLETADGGVTALVAGTEDEYAIETYSYMGETNLTDKEDGEKVLKAYSMSGKIDIQFEG